MAIPAPLATTTPGGSMHLTWTQERATEHLSAQIAAKLKLTDEDDIEAKNFRAVPFEDLFVPPQANGTDFGVRGVARGASGGIKSVDESQLSEQKTVVMHLIKTMGSNLMEGKSIINISLPVKVFEPRSFLERLADVWSFAPLYLTKAAKCTDPVQRLKWTVTFLISGLHRGTVQRKPFNPILGETYQARFPDGSSICCEQVSHHPPVSAFEVHGPDGLWKLQGRHQYTASFRPNGVLGGQVGPNVVTFQDGTQISYNMPTAKISGLVMGERNMTYDGTLKFLDQQNHLRCEITLNPDAVGGLKSWIVSAATPSDTFRGKIFLGTREVCDVSGSWLEQLKFGTEQFWKIGQYKHCVPVPLPRDSVLPSDCRFRTDLIALKRGLESVAQSEKERLENLQRADKKLRKKSPKTPSSSSSSRGKKDAAQPQQQAQGGWLW